MSVIQRKQTSNMRDYDVDDMMVIGRKESIIDVQERVEKVFSIITENKLADNLGCEFHMNRDKTRGWLGQPTIIRKEIWLGSHETQTLSNSRNTKIYCHEGQ